MRGHIQKTDNKKRRNLPKKKNGEEKPSTATFMVMTALTFEEVELKLERTKERFGKSILIIYFMLWDNSSNLLF